MTKILTCVTMVGHICAALLVLHAVRVTTTQLTPFKFFSTASFARGSCDTHTQKHDKLYWTDVSQYEHLCRNKLIELKRLTFSYDIQYFWLVEALLVVH